MLRSRNKAAREAAVKQEKQPAPVAPSRVRREPVCRCGGTGLVNVTVPASARGPIQYIRRACACQNRKK